MCNRKYQLADGLHIVACPQNKPLSYIFETIKQNKQANTQTNKHILKEWGETLLVPT